MPIRIVSWNVNGLRSCLSKGFLRWLAEDGADIVCERQRYDDVVGDEAACLIATAPGIGQAQGDQVVYASAQCRLAFGACECSLVDRERVRVAPVEEEAEAP